MSLKFGCLGMMLRIICFSLLITLLHTIDSSAPLNGPTGTILDEHGWVVLKEEIINPLNNTVQKIDASNSDALKSAAHVKNTALNIKNHPEVHNDTSDKDQSLYTCPNVTLRVGQYDINDNGTLHVRAFRLTLNSSFYIQNGDLVTICRPMKKEEEFSTPARIVLTFLTFAYSLITMLSSLCSFSRNSTYLKLALVSWICVSLNIFLWIIVILIIPGPQSLFSWVSMSVNMNQSVYLTSAWMALLTSSRALKFLQKYSFIEISQRVVIVRVGPLGILCVVFASAVAALNYFCDKIAFVEDEELSNCLFCNPIIYATICLMVMVDFLLSLYEKNLSDVSRDYASYHQSLCKFSIFNFYCIGVGAFAVLFEFHIMLWMYTLFNFLWPLFFMENIIPRLQTLMAMSSDNNEKDEKIPMPSTKLISHK